jgi:hypothetical protein
VTTATDPSIIITLVYRTFSGMPADRGLFPGAACSQRNDGKRRSGGARSGPKIKRAKQNDDELNSPGARCTRVRQSAG